MLIIDQYTCNYKMFLYSTRGAQLLSLSALLVGQKASKLLFNKPAFQHILSLETNYQSKHIAAYF